MEAPLLRCKCEQWRAGSGGRSVETGEERRPGCGSIKYNGRSDLGRRIRGWTGEIAQRALGPRVLLLGCGCMREKRDAKLDLLSFLLFRNGNLEVLYSPTCVLTPLVIERDVFRSVSPKSPFFSRQIPPLLSSDAL